MRSLTIHPASLALGLVLGGIALLSMGQATFTPTPLGSTVRVEYLAHPRDMVQINGGTPYTVPAGKLLVVTALGMAEQPGTSGSSQLRVNGQTEVIGSLFGPNPVPGGLAVSPGSIITLTESYNGTSHPSLRAWGYLAPQ